MLLFFLCSIMLFHHIVHNLKFELLVCVYVFGIRTCKLSIQKGVTKKGL